MPGSERVASSGKNLRSALVGQVLIFTVNLITRRIFIRLLGSEYVGLSGLCGHLLGFLSLLEPGFDAACVFALYKPLAFGDRILTAQICTYLKRIYRRVSFLTLVAGVLLTPLAVSLSDGDKGVSGVALIWVLSVLEMSFSYLFSHRKVLPFADQRAYLITTYGYVFFIVSQGLRLFALVRYGSFIAYLVAGMLSSLLEEVLIYLHTKRNYPYMENAPYPIPESERKNIISQVRALFFHKVGAVVYGSVDNMAVFIFLGLSGGALYSNYTMLSGTCLAFIGIMTSSTSASVGNLGVTAGEKRMERVFSTSFFAILFAGGFLASALFFVYPDIMKLWMGENMVLGTLESALFAFSMFVSAIRRPVGVFLDGCGLFEKEKYKAVIEALIAGTVTFILAPRLKICGVLMGQISASAFFSFWYETVLLYKYGFKVKYSKFLRELLRYAVALVFSVFLCGVLCNFVGGTGISQLLWKIAVCAVSFVSVFFVLFFDSTRFRDTLTYAGRILKKA